MFAISVPQTAASIPHRLWKISVSLLALALATSTVHALSADGWAGEGNGTDGGTGGATVTVDNAEDYIDYVESTATLIIRIDGTIDIGSNDPVKPKPNKTIVGIGTTGKIIGTHILNANAENIIFKNLTLTTYDMLSDSDAISIRGAKNIWINHCTIYNCADGMVDLGLGADYVTISWCKFYYTEDFGHNLVTLIGSNNDHDETDEGHLRTTLHHNWYGENCVGRMPMVRFGKVHSYNNYYNAADCNMYIGVAWMSEILLEKCYFEDGNQSTGKIWHYYEVNGKLDEVDCVFVGVPQNASGGNDTVFSPPYSYSPDATLGVKAIVMAGAGVNGLEIDSAVTSLTLINADTDLPIAGFNPFLGGAVLDLSELPTTNLNIRANVGGSVGSVRFALDANPNYRTENGAPYALAGDNSGNYNPWTPSTGSHTLNATAWSGSGASGSNLGSHPISFTVVP